MAFFAWHILRGLVAPSKKQDFDLPFQISFSGESKVREDSRDGHQLFMEAFIDYTA